MDKKRKISGPVLAISLFVAVFSVLVGIVGVLVALGKLPRRFREKQPIHRSFQRDDGELRRGT